MDDASVADPGELCPGSLEAASFLRERIAWATVFGYPTGVDWSCQQVARKAAMAGVNVPPKVRDLVSLLEQAGFRSRAGKGSHRNYVHPRVSKPLTISGKLGDDAKPYQTKAVRQALQELK